MTVEERLTQALEDADALARLLAIVMGDTDGENAYLCRKIQENALTLSKEFRAFCSDVNDEVSDLRGQLSAVGIRDLDISASVGGRSRLSSQHFSGAAWPALS